MSDEKEPIWLNREDIDTLHDLAIEFKGGAEGIRDNNLIESALVRPQNLYTYEGETDPYVLAAAYAEGLAQNHGYVDGNKRVGFAAAETFLNENGIELQPSPGDEHAIAMENIVEGQITREDLAQHFEEYSIKVEYNLDVYGAEDNYKGAVETTISIDGVKGLEEQQANTQTRPEEQNELNQQELSADPSEQEDPNLSQLEEWARKNEVETTSLEEANSRLQEAVDRNNASANEKNLKGAERDTPSNNRDDDGYGL